MFKLQISQSNIDGLVQTIDDLKSLLAKQEQFINREVVFREEGDKQIQDLLDVVNGDLNTDGSFRKAVDDLKLEIDTAQLQFSTRVNAFHTSILRNINDVSRNVSDLNALFLQESDDAKIEELNTLILSETNDRRLEDANLKELIAVLDGRITSSKKLKTIDEDLLIEEINSVVSVKPLFKPEVILNFNTCRVKIDEVWYDFEVVVKGDRIIIENDISSLILVDKFAKVQYTTFI